MKKYSLRDHYKNFPECKREDVLKLMSWNKQQPHLPSLEEEEIICFLHSCYYSVELAKQTIDINYTTKTHCPEFFANLDVRSPGLQMAMSILDVCELKKRTPEGYRVVIGQLKDSDVNKFEFTETLKLYCLCYERILYENGLSNGDVVLMDMTGVTLGHVTRLGVMSLKKFLYFIQEGAPLRLRGYHFLNAVPFMDTIIALMKPFLTTDFLNIMKVHTTMDTVYQYVPKEILPSDFYGGDKSIRELAGRDIFELKKRTPEGYRVVLSKFSDCDPTKYNLAHTLKLYCACYEQILVEGGMASGEVIVMDMAGTTLGHVARAGLMTVKKMMFYLQEGAPIRLRGYHFLNAPPFTDQVLNIIKPFLKPEFFKWLKVHYNMDSIYPYVPKDILPSDYGGEGESIRELTDEFYARLVKNREYFLEEERTRRVNEKLRPGRPKNPSDLFGAEGNFKKLDID